MNKPQPKWKYRGHTYSPLPGMLSQGDLLARGITRNKTFRYAERGLIRVTYHGGRRWFTAEAVKAMKG